MRVVVQRVSSASVVIEGKLHNETGPGMLVLVGIEEEDSEEDAVWLSGKLARLRIFDDSHGVMNLSLGEAGGEILLISQFTLHASTRKGNRPSYIRAARPEKAIPLYDFFTSCLEKEAGVRVKTGVFGAMMDVSLVNAGPVTILIDSRNRE